MMTFRRFSKEEMLERYRGTDLAPIGKGMLDDTNSRRWQRSFAWVAKRVLEGIGSFEQIRRFGGEAKRTLQRMKQARSPEDRLATLIEFQNDNPWLADAFALIQATDPDPDGVKTGTDLLAELPNVLFLWKPWIPRGMVTLLIAPPGMGKTAFAIGGLVRPIVSATDWPDEKTSLDEPGNVLYVDTENGQAILAERLRKWKIPPERIKLPGQDVFSSVKLDKPEDVDDLFHLVRSLKPEMVIVDSLRGSHGKDENNSRIGVEIMEALSTLAQKSNTAVVVIHHTRKLHDGETVTADASRGSNALVAHSRSVIALDKPDSKSEWIRVSVVKSNVAKPPDPLGFRITESGLEFGSAPERESKADKISRSNEAEKFLYEILAAGPTSAKEVQRAAKSAGISEATLRRARAKIGVITPRGGKSTWRLPSNPAQNGHRKQMNKFSK